MLNENCTNLFLGYSYCVEGYSQCHRSVMVAYVDP